MTTTEATEPSTSQRQLSLADMSAACIAHGRDALMANGYLGSTLFIDMGESIAQLPVNLTDHAAQQAFLANVRNICVAFRPHAVALICESLVRPAASDDGAHPELAADPESWEVMTLHLASPREEFQILSEIRRDASGGVVDVVPVSGPRAPSNVRGLTGFYPATSPSASERAAARETLKDVLPPCMFDGLQDLADRLPTV
jgi:hypothetical protein